MTEFRQDGDIPLQLDQLLNKGLELGDNLRGALLEKELNEGENEILHDLGFTPIGYLVIYQSEDGRIFGSREDEWTNQVMFLESSVPNQTVRLFVL